MPFCLHKPVRSRDLLQLLESLEAHLEHSGQTSPAGNDDITRPVMAALTPADLHQDSHLDSIFNLLQHSPKNIYKINFDHTHIYINTEKKRVLLPTNFSYDKIINSHDFAYQPCAQHEIADGYSATALSDFFYELTIEEKTARLLSELKANFIFQIKQWPQFSNPNNSRALIKICAYFSKHKATLQSAAQDLSLGMEQLIGFINAVHAQNLLVFEKVLATAPVVNHGMTPALAEIAPTVASSQTVKTDTSKALGGLFGRIRQRLGL